MPEETKRKISLANTGNTSSVGRVVSAETRAKIGAANKGRLVGLKRSPEVREKIRQGRLGIKLSEEVKQKMREERERKKQQSI